MTDRPILFSGPMVRALLAGTKTQTRRDLTKTFARYPQLEGYETNGTLKPIEGRDVPCVEFAHSELGLWHPDKNPSGRSGWYVPLKAAVGDRLWVRENAAVVHQGWHHVDGDTHTVAYRADEDDYGRWIGLPSCGAGVRRGKAPSVFPSRSHNVDGSLRWQPSIHMPRWASRLTLTVTDVRVERLQDISVTDAIAEGVTQEKVGAHVGWSGRPDGGIWPDPANAYWDLWDYVNGEGAWDLNPWVVAYTFTVHRDNIDQLGDLGARGSDNG